MKIAIALMLAVLGSFLCREASAAQCAIVGGVATNIPCTPQQFGAVADGGNHPLSGFYGSLGAAQAVYPFVTSLAQQIDYAAIKLMSNTALGADGAENGIPNSYKNMPMVLPCGVYNLGSDTWHINRADGIRIQGAGTTCATIESNGIVFQTDGLWYSNISSLGFTSNNIGSPPATVDIDGNTGLNGTTFSVQGNNFYGMIIDGNGSTYGWAMCRQGGSSGQCSENTFRNFHGQLASTAVWYLAGSNAIDNLLDGGDMQNFPLYGIYGAAGSFEVNKMSFEGGSGFAAGGYQQIVNGGCDIAYNNFSANDTITIYGVRTQDFCLYLGGAGFADIRNVSQLLAGVYTWAPSTAFVLNNTVYGTDASGFTHIFRVTTAGTSGSGSHPTWPTSGTVTDGSITWTLTNYIAIDLHGNTGSFDAKSSYIDSTAIVYPGDYINLASCGTGQVNDAGQGNQSDIGSNQWSGKVTEGNPSTGCTAQLKLPTVEKASYYNLGAGATVAPKPPNCVVTSPTGTVVTGYSVVSDGFGDWNLTWTHAPTTTPLPQFNWSCQQ